MNTLIRLTDLEKVFRVGEHEIRAVNGISLDIERGEIFGMIGHSGAGKSTLLRLINFLERPSAGQVAIDGVEIGSLDAAGLRVERRKIGMIFQHFNLLSAKTVAQNVALPLEIAGELAPREIAERVQQLLQRVELTGQAAKYPSQLSGGQKQRVGIARALATQAKILLCDEATSALDPQTTQSVLRLLSEINQELGLTIVLITHEMDVIRRICDRVAVLDAGRVVEMGPVADVFLHPRHPTTRRFVLEAEHVNEDELSDDFAHVKGKVIRLTFRGEATYEPLLSKLMREYDIDFSILAGRIDRIKEMPYGQLTLALEGERTEQVMARLRQETMTLEELR